MADRVKEELDLLRSVYPDLEYKQVDGVHWVRLQAIEIPVGWSHQRVDVAFRIPGSAGQAPYAFLVRPCLTLQDGSAVDRYTCPVATPWEGEWGQFSWSPEGWVPTTDIRTGSNMLTFVRSFDDRLGQVG